jgi:hypothetical protein
MFIRHDSARPKSIESTNRRLSNEVSDAIIGAYLSSPTPANIPTGSANAKPNAAAMPTHSREMVHF